MKKIILIISLFFLISCKKDIVTILPGLTKVELLSYPDRMMWDTIPYKTENSFYKELTDNGKLNFDTTMVKERLILNENQLKQLNMILQETCSINENVAACYMPRHLILFRNKNNKIIAYNEFCFDCVGSRNSKNLDSYQKFCMNDMAGLFKKFGIKYFGNTKEQKRMENDIFDSIQKVRSINNKKILK